MSTKKILATLAVFVLLALNQPFPASAENVGGDGEEGATTDSMTRIMMLPPDAEVTGMHIDANGNFFVNAMHPDDNNYKATVGVINGIDWNNLPSNVTELESTSSEWDIWHGIRTSQGDYQVLLQSGDDLSEGGVAGGIYAADDGNRIFTSEKPDYNAFVPLDPNGSRGYLYTAWEDRPAGISQLEIEWNTSSAEWDVLGGMMLNLSSVAGGWVLCFGTLSPWDSPLLSEELYFANTKYWNDESYNYHYDQVKLEDYLGYYPNPYDYGYIMEIENSSTIDPDFIKHFSMGRFSHENAQVMPDERTVYLSDDGYDTVLFKFIADMAGDLSSGTLYAAKVIQDDGSDSATTGFDVEWIEMASSSNSVIQTWIEEYDGITTSDFIAGQNSYITDEEITDWAEGRLNDDLNGDGTIGTAADDRVAFLESRKAAAALGASDEWNKMEGVVFNPNAPDYLYLAMSDIRNDMSDGQGDIDVSQNRCGIVYRMTLEDDWNVDRIEPVISGGPYTSSATYECDVNNLAGPDNLVVLDDGRVLVGEDTGKHEYNMVWLWEPAVEPETGGGVVGDGNETISVNHVVLVEAPPQKEWSWKYGYQAEVNGLQADVNYTAIILIKGYAEPEWGGLEWWWDDIGGDGDQFNNTFSLQRGCFHINASLYESGDLNSDAENAAVLASSGSDFVVGAGTCVDGVYAEEDEEPGGGVDENGTQENGTQDGAGDTDERGLEGFGIILCITAALGAAVIVARRE